MKRGRRSYRECIGELATAQSGIENMCDQDLRALPNMYKSFILGILFTWLLRPLRYGLLGYSVDIY